MWRFTRSTAVTSTLGGGLPKRHICFSPSEHKQSVYLWHVNKSGASDGHVSRPSPLALLQQITGTGASGCVRYRARYRWPQVQESEHSVQEGGHPEAIWLRHTLNTATPALLESLWSRAFIIPSIVMKGRGGGGLHMRRLWFAWSLLRLNEHATISDNLLWLQTWPYGRAHRNIDWCFCEAAKTQRG